jgi:hypothetical protein
VNCAASQKSRTNATEPHDKWNPSESGRRFETQLIPSEQRCQFRMEIKHRPEFAIQFIDSAPNSRAIQVMSQTVVDLHCNKVMHHRGYFPPLIVSPAGLIEAIRLRRWEHEWTLARLPLLPLDE